jgi:transcriptional regulator with XRE-family HTH domain
MIHFNPDQVDMFLGVVRKYMQIRGGLSQKDLAESLNIGISTMSRFLSQKTKDFDPQLIASIVAKLAIPLHEIIDFVDEESTQTFKKLVQFYKGTEVAEEQVEKGPRSDMDDFEQGLDSERTRTQTTASVSVGGRRLDIPFGGENNKRTTDLTLREKLDRLSPRQKGFMTDFLDLDGEGRDLIVDVANSLFRYFKQQQGASF